MPRAVASILLSLVAWALLPGSVAADSPTNGSIIVLGDHVTAGETFAITGYDIEPGIGLELEIVNGTRMVSLGNAVVGEDGTMNATVALPATFPDGYANLTATSEADGQWMTAVLVGERAEGPGVQQTVADDGALRTLALLVLAAGVVIFLAAGARYVRR